MVTNCPKVEKCPIFINNVLTLERAAVAYKTLYCQAGEAKYKSCKRYIISNTVGSCPPDVLPNSSRTVDEIIAKMSR
jgi:hypothetical protein